MNKKQENINHKEHQEAQRKKQRELFLFFSLCTFVPLVVPAFLS
jgi:hypothetical protein